MKRSFLWRRALEFKRELSLISGLTLLSSMATLSVPWLAGQLLGRLADDTPTDLGKITGLLVLALVIMTAMNIAASMVTAQTSGRILARLRLDAYGHIQNLPIGFHEQSRRGDLLAMMTYEVRLLSDFLTSTIANVPAMLMTAGGAVILLFLIDPTIAFIVPILVPVFFIVLKLLSRRLRGLAERVRETEAKVMWIADSDLEMIPAIKSFATEARHSKAYARIVDAARVLSLQEDRITASIGPVIALAAGLATIAIIVLATSGEAVGERDPAEMFAFLLYAALLTRPVGGLANVYGQWQIARGTAARMEKIFAVEPEIDGFGNDITNASLSTIRFENVSFGYDSREPILRGINFVIEPAQVIALTGANGAGKSTLIRLLLRFYEPDAGRILHGSNNIADLQIQAWRRQIGYVPQRALLFNGTIADNIEFGCEEAEPQAMERAARQAQAWEFIAQLPDGLHTEIGDNGIRLSGGERQRIALARALLNDPPILILDEATSMYDLESEAAFIAECESALSGRTIIIITHRTASLALADRVFEVSDQTVCEVATQS